jgi:hypothetical protein
MCCLENTHFPAVDCPSSQLLDGYATFLRVRNSRDNKSVLAAKVFYAFFTKLDDNFTLRLLSPMHSRESVLTYRHGALCNKPIAVLAPSPKPILIDTVSRFSGPRIGG